MSVCLVWVGDAEAAAAVVGAAGPWREVREAAPGLLLVESDDSLSQVYHHVKWLLPEDCPLLGAVLQDRPKARGVAAGTVSWLRSRLPLPAKPPTPRR